MATLRDIAKHAKTSVSTVAAVLNGVGKQNIRVSQSTRDRVLAAASEQGYTPNLVARSLVTGKTHTLGLVFPYSGAYVDHNPFSMQIMSGVLEEAVRSKYNLMLHTAVGDNWNAFDENALTDSRVDGLILTLPHPNSSVIESPVNDCVRLVAIVYAPLSKEVCAVNSDDYSGGKLAVQHLIGLGHRKIAHLSGNPVVATTLPRIQGYMDALEEASISFDSALLLSAGFSWRDGYTGMEQLLELPISQQPTAVFAANDLCADGVLKLLHERRFRIPQDIAVVGYDDTWFATMTRPALTSVHMPIYEMGLLATQMLIALVEGRELPEWQPVLPVSLTIRESSQA